MNKKLLAVIGGICLALGALILAVVLVLNVVEAFMNRSEALTVLNDNYNMLILILGFVLLCVPMIRRELSGAFNFGIVLVLAHNVINTIDYFGIGFKGVEATALPLYACAALIPLIMILIFSIRSQRGGKPIGIYYLPMLIYFICNAVVFAVNLINLGGSFSPLNALLEYAFYALVYFCMGAFASEKMIKAPKSKKETDLKYFYY